MTLKTAGIIAGAVLVAFASGWCTGASGKTSLAVQLSETGIRADIAEVRAAVMDARLSLSESNFGDAQRALERAGVIAQRLQARLRATGRSDRAGAVDRTIAQLGDAARLSGQLDPSATDIAADALRALETSVPVPAP